MNVGGMGRHYWFCLVWISAYIIAVCKNIGSQIVMRTTAGLYKFGGGRSEGKKKSIEFRLEILIDFPFYFPSLFDDLFI